MSFWKMAAIVFLLLGCAVTSANAQWSSTEAGRNIEITPFGGSRFGGAINTNSQGFSTIDELTIKSTWDYGIMGDVDLFPNSFPGLQAEFMWSRQPTDLGAHDANTGIITPAGDVTLDNYQWSALYNMRQPGASLRPFVVAGMGFTHFGSDGALPFDNRLSFNVGGGVKYFFARHAGLRLDVRWMPSRTTSQVGTFFDPFYGYYQANINNYAEQFQTNLGLILRF